MRLILSLLLISTLALSAGCKTTAGNFCDVTEAYRPEAGEVYSERNKRRIVALNEYGEKACGWKP